MWQVTKLEKVEDPKEYQLRTYLDKDQPDILKKFNDNLRERNLIIQRIKINYNDPKIWAPYIQVIVNYSDTSYDKVEYCNFPYHMHLQEPILPKNVKYTHDGEIITDNFLSIPINFGRNPNDFINIVRTDIFEKCSF
jgi:hypothetical protein